MPTKFTTLIRGAMRLFGNAGVFALHRGFIVLLCGRLRPESMRRARRMRPGRGTVHSGTVPARGHLHRSLKNRC